MRIVSEFSVGVVGVDSLEGDGSVVGSGEVESEGADASAEAACL